jgi:hypothetical protein
MDSNVANELNGVIDYLASKFSVTSQYLIETMSRYYLTKNLTNSIICLIMLFVFGFLLYKAPWRKTQEEIDKMTCREFDNYDIFSTVFTVCLGLLLLSVSIIFIIHFSHLIGVVLTPDGYTITQILETLHGSTQ